MTYVIGILLTAFMIWYAFHTRLSAKFVIIEVLSYIVGLLVGLGCCYEFGWNPGIGIMQCVLIGSEYPVMDTLLFYVENGETPEMSLLTRSRRHSSLTLCSVSRAMYCFVMPQSRPIRSRLLISTTYTDTNRCPSMKPMK